MHDIGCGCVFDMMDLTHVARDHENFVSLKFHERRRRNKSVHCHRAPVDPAEDIVHLFDPRNTLERNTGIEQPLKIDFVCVFLQEENVLAHDETPDRVIERGVFFVALIDCELQQMFWQGLHCAISSAERLNTHRVSSVRISADSFYDVGILGARAVIPSVSRGIPWSYLKDSRRDPWTLLGMTMLVGRL